MFKRKLRVIGLTALALFVLAAQPAVAGGGATQIVETWTDEPVGLFYHSQSCLGTDVAGYGVASGTAQITETPDGGVHVRGHEQTVWQLYEASGPPWDVTFGAFFGTFTVNTNFDEQIGPDGQGTDGRVSHGFITYPDGSRQFYNIVFRLVRQPDGPPRLFLVRIACGAKQ